MDQAAAIVKQIADAIALYGEIWILIGLGIFYTVITRECNPGSSAICGR